MSGAGDAKDTLLDKLIKTVVSQVPGVVAPWLNEYFDIVPASAFFEPFPSRWAKISTVFAALVAALFFARLVWRATPPTWPERLKGGLAAVLCFLAGSACLLRYSFLIDTTYVVPLDSLELPAARLSLTAWYAGGFGLLAFGIGTALLLVAAQLPRKEKKA